MDVKRLENIRDFIINEIDCGRIQKGEKYSNVKLNCEWYLYFALKDLDIMIYDFSEYNDEIIMKVFNGIMLKGISRVDAINGYITISLDKEQDFKLLNRKRKLWILKD